MENKTITAPEPLDDIPEGMYVFLAGSIEMGLADNWQKKLIDEVDPECKYSMVFLNPRRTDWDASWEQSINNSKFREQVEWEINALNESNIILFYFDPKTKSPITLFELGLMINNVERDRTIIVCCPDGYWRQGNVEIYCNNFGIKFSRDWGTFVKQSIRAMNPVYGY